MKNYKDLVEWCKKHVGTKYLYGYKMEKITQAKNKYLAKNYPNVWSTAYLNKANSWVNDVAVDCSGLISSFTGILRGSYNYKETAIKVLDYKKGMDLTPYIGWAMWKPGHIGVITGKDECIEAKGINYGTVISKASTTPFTKILKLKDIDYTNKHQEETGEAIGWHKDNTGWWYRHTKGKGQNTYCNNGIFLLDTSKGKMFFAFDKEGYLINNVNKLFITDYGNIEVK